ncbi:hypothetical protein HDA32_005503 [Spinactinospora alkalitolerans]|uniref:DUF397 domain-containing protein n=1 Tax=Spinactinospora alkalitolerans TaxID=687207 RepID=A0A852U684_9ACTN|nr:DUF397 domain-containing protein [Spinactinospora alkalitolerans]NYE50383.1 hypothetical protein [Spinactinospora alkalitolerans]
MTAPAVNRLDWRKSSYSGTNANCVECASASWARSSYSGATSSNCVEWASLPSSVALRDSKNPEAGHLSLAAPEWSAFLTAVKRGEL